MITVFITRSRSGNETVQDHSGLRARGTVQLRSKQGQRGSGMYALFADGMSPSLHDSKDAAIRAAREAGADAFAVYDDDDNVVYQESPIPVWV
jgi:hypothetical protein